MICMCVYIYIYIHTYYHKMICRERERERDRHIDRSIREPAPGAHLQDALDPLAGALQLRLAPHIYIYIYIHTCVCVWGVGDVCYTMLYNNSL